MTYLVLGEVEYAWGHLQQAETLLRQSMQHSEHWSDINLRLRSLAILIRLLRSRGATDQAQELAEHLESLGWQVQATRATLLGQALQARLLLDQGRATQARYWAEHADALYVQSPAYLNEPLAILYCRILCENSMFTEAQHMLARLQAATEEAKHHKSILEIMTIRVILLQKMGMAQQAQQQLVSLVELAAPQHCLYTFLEERQTLVPLLTRLANTTDQHSVLSPFGQIFLIEILSYLNIETASSSHLPSDPHVTLTAREQEVLTLLAQGLTNLQIAQQLFIGQSTVKWHLKNLALKLGVHTRLQIVHQAQRLHLLLS